MNEGMKEGRKKHLKLVSERSMLQDVSGEDGVVQDGVYGGPVGGEDGVGSGGRWCGRWW